jgi:2-amino-4-hydroxy-6-hydroxymethyldihydropteridine diphosphokinase
MVNAYIGMGSNIGDGKRTLQDAWKFLGDLDDITLLRLSSPYLSAPVDMVSQHWFTNAVGVVATSLGPVELLRTLLEVEAVFGRTRAETGFGYQDRSLDLDLLYFQEVVMDTPELVLPHPHVGKRLFVLEPLAEITPDSTMLVAGVTVSQMIEDLQHSFHRGESKKQEINKSFW